MRRAEINLFDLSEDLSEEITGISMMISGLSNQLDNSETDTLSPCALKEALFGISRYLERIAEDLDHISNTKFKRKGA